MIDVNKIKAKGITGILASRKRAIPLRQRLFTVMRSARRVKCC